MKDLSLQAHNTNQFDDLKRIKQEVKWYVGEKLGYNPDETPEGQKEVSDYLAGVIISGAGKWMSDRLANKK
jgi:hypothetical protein